MEKEDVLDNLMECSALCGVGFIGELNFLDFSFSIISKDSEIREEESQ